MTYEADKQSSEPCRKCGNPVLVQPRPCGSDVTSRPCPICGDQNYSYPDGMVQTSGAAQIYEQTCSVCCETFFTAHSGVRKYCDECGPRARMQVRRLKGQRFRRNLMFGKGRD